MAMFAKYVGAVLSLTVVAAQPAVAAEQLSLAASSLTRPAAFGGLTVRLPLSRQGRAKPEARVQLTTYRMDAAEAGHVRTFDPRGIQLGLSKAGKPLLFAGGENVSQVKQRLGLNTGTTLLIVGGVVAAVVVVALASGGAGMGDTCPEFNGSRDHCINP